MKKIKLEKDILLYQFESDSDSLIGLNITVLFNDKDYLLIDTGYQTNMKEVLIDLEGYTCTHVINTHYHPDHTYGLYELDDVIKIGSSNFINTLKDFDLFDEKILHPTIEVGEKFEYKYGNHSFTMTRNIGHSICGMIIDLDSKYLFVGDDLLITNEGEAILPYLTLNDINYPIKAIETIRKHSDRRIIIPAHGKVLENSKEINKHLDIKVKYYEFVIDNSDLNDFENKTGIKLKGRLSWHEHNVEVIKLNKNN